jgi:hypothetical protein
MTRIARILLALCLFLSIARQGIAVEGVDTPRLQAARLLVATLGLPELFVAGARRGIEKSMNEDPSRIKEMDWLLAQVTVAAATERIALIYAEFLTAYQADELRRFFSGSPGNKYLWAMNAAELAGRPFSPPLLTADEDRQAQAFFRNNVSWRTLTQSQTAIRSKIDAASTIWMRELVQRTDAELGRQMADVLDPNGTSGAKDGSGAAAGPLAALVPLMRDYKTRNQKSIAEFSRRVGEIELGTVLKPVNLTSRVGIAEGRAKVDRYEAEFDRRWRDYNAATDELIQAMKSIAVSPAIRKGFMVGAENGMANAYERALRLGENQRTMISLMRRILALADERFDKIKLENDHLLFDDTADLNTYEDLRQRLVREGTVETKLAEEEKRAGEAGLRMLRGDTAATADAARVKSALDNAHPDTSAPVRSELAVTPGR